MLQFALELKEKALSRDNASTLATGAILYLIYLSDNRRVEVDEMYRWVTVSCEYSPFQHTPLETENHFRLISIRKTALGEVIEFRLQEYDLVNAPKHISLSYTWGNPSVTLPILLNDQKHSVTQNLHNALQHFRQNLIQLVEGEW